MILTTALLHLPRSVRFVEHPSYPTVILSVQGKLWGGEGTGVGIAKA